jgi:hypothetical protein
VWDNVIDTQGTHHRHADKTTRTAQVKQYYPHFYHKTDKFGRPVYYELLGELNAAELMKATTVERLVRYHIRCWERATQQLLPACSRAAGRQIFTCVTILDLKGISRSAFSASVRAFLREITTLDQVRALLCQQLCHLLCPLWCPSDCVDICQYVSNLPPGCYIRNCYLLRAACKALDAAELAML